MRYADSFGASPRNAGPELPADCKQRKQRTTMVPKCKAANRAVIIHIFERFLELHVAHACLRTASAEHFLRCCFGWDYPDRCHSCSEMACCYHNHSVQVCGCRNCSGFADCQDLLAALPGLKQPATKRLMLVRLERQKEVTDIMTPGTLCACSTWVSPSQ